MREGFIRDLLSSGPPVLVYHWDADGMISAMHIVSMAGQDTIMLPPKFTFRVDDDFIRSLKAKAAGRRPIIILDLSYPGRVIDRIARETGVHILVVDHHYQDEGPREPNVEYVNPARKGDPEGEWPSTAHVLARILGEYHPGLVAASIVGDLGPRAKANKHYQNYMVEAGLDPVRDYWVVEQVVSQLDSISVTANYDGLKWIPKVHAIGQFDPLKSILNDPLLTTLKTNVEVEFESLLEEAKSSLVEEAPGVLGVKLSGESRLASRLARSLASMNPGRVVVVAYHSTGIDRAYIYARAYKLKAQLAGIAEYFKRLGFEAGGKYQEDNNVVAVECPPREMERVYRLMVEKVREVLGA